MTRWSPHLHLEADTDVRYPRHSPTFGASGSVIFGRGAGATADSVRDALSYLYLKPTPPDSQTYQTDGKPYVDDRDLCVGAALRQKKQGPWALFFSPLTGGWSCGRIGAKGCEEMDRLIFHVDVNSAYLSLGGHPAGRPGRPGPQDGPGGHRRCPGQAHRA